MHLCRSYLIVGFLRLERNYQPNKTFSIMTMFFSSLSVRATIGSGCQSWDASLVQFWVHSLTSVWLRCIIPKTIQASLEWNSKTLPSKVTMSNRGHLPDGHCEKKIIVGFLYKINTYHVHFVVKLLRMRSSTAGYLLKYSRQDPLS